jgi:Arc/MetJ-type ribon-helix-helix transcriptional regulator
MQIQLTDQGQRVVEQLLAEGRFQSADEAVEDVLGFLQDCEPTMDSINAKLREAHEAHEAHEAGESAPLDMDEIKAELQKRFHNSQNV